MISPLKMVLWSNLLVISSVSGLLPCDPPCENGQCIADHGQLSCRCNANFFGDSCVDFVCEREANLCQNGGSCVMDRTNSSIYHCVCPPNVLGDRCQYIAHFNSCSTDTCNGNGYCYGDGLGSTECVCFPGHYGSNCQFNGSDPCSIDEVQHCFGHGSCTYTSQGNFVCDCDTVYESIFNCEFLIVAANICAIATPCQSGGECHAIVPYDYNCLCPANFHGKNCTIPFDPCTNACENGGTCTPIANRNYFQCLCPAGYTGQRCDVILEINPGDGVNCTSLCSSCQNGGACSNNGSSSFCQCLPGFTGEHCEVLDHCGHPQPCSNNTQAPHCVNTDEVMAGYICTCADGWGGPTCHLDINECFTSPCNDGACINLPGGFRCHCPTGTSGTLCDSVIEVCPTPECQELAGNGECNRQCNLASCNFDAFECDVADPWRACPTPTFCREHYGDEVCNIQCNSAGCLYDGGECSPGVEECGLDVCRDVVADDGVCVMECTTPQCPYDYNDCSRGGDTFARNRLVLILFSECDQPFTSPWKDEFLRDLGVITNSVPVLDEVVELTREDLDEVLMLSFHNKLIYKVVVRLDISYCSDHCLQDANDAVVLIYANIVGVSSKIGPYSIGKASAEPDPPPPSVSWYYIVIGIAIILVGISLTVIIILLGKRRRVTAKIWRPKSPSSETERTQTPVTAGGNSGGAITGTESSSQGLESIDYMGKGSKKARMASSDMHVDWNDDSVPLTSGSQPNHVVIGQQGRDSRQWGISHSRDVTKLVQQYKKQNGSSLNINIPGPGGFTPLMLAVMRRPGTYACFNYQSRSSSESSSDDQAALIPPVSSGTPRHFVIPPVDSSVSMLLHAKADLDAVNDYNQTALHLAAACSRAAYVDQLLEAGANPNIPDNWGQNALHAAIGASAEGAFMVLLNHPQTKVNLKSDGGITPLMAAVKMVNIFMVTQLLKKDSDIISATDNDGRTAVHWAAMVDNLDALRMLVSRGPDTIKDAQDNKGQTALFLACREGSIMCAKHLIDCFANVTLYDNLDQSPLQIAKEKQCHEIVDLLMASTHVPYTMRQPHGPTYTEMVPFPPPPPPPPTQPLVMPSSSKKKKSKLSVNGMQQQLLQQQLHGNKHFMSPDIQHSAPSTTTSSFPPHQSSPNPSHHYLSPTSNYNNSTHSPPLPQPPISAYPSTSISTHRRYSNATPPESSATHPTPPYDPHQQPVLIGEELPTTTSAGPHAGVHHRSMLDNYQMYTTSDGTRPLQHLSVGTEVGIQTSFVQSQNGVYSPPSGSLSQKSPTSNTFHSPPNCTSYGASPQSLTPSPDAQGIDAQGTINALGTVHIEGGSYNYNPYIIPPQYLIGTTPV